jgi:hypothetical protein
MARYFSHDVYGLSDPRFRTIFDAESLVSAQETELLRRSILFHFLGEKGQDFMGYDNVCSV